MAITVKEAVLQTAQMLGISKGVNAYLDGEDDQKGEKDVGLLLAAFQKVENELALDYLPLMAEEELVTTTGCVSYDELNYPVARILCVEDEWGNSLKFQIFPSYMKTQTGKVKIIYAYAPEEKNIDGVSDYEIAVSLRLFTYGMATEYSLAMGELTAASVWDKKYKDAVQAAYRLRPCKKLRSRRWA